MSEKGMEGWIGPFGVVVGMLLLVGCNGKKDVGQTEEGGLVLGRSEVTERVERGVAPGNRLLVLDGFKGAVQLEGAEAQTAQLTFTKRARGRDDQAARKVLRNVSIRESGTDERYTYTMESSSAERSAVDVRGTVPPTTRLLIQFESGQVALAGIRGPIDVMHESGNVQIAGAAASVNVTIRNGSIQVGMQRLPADARVQLETSNGDIALALPKKASAQVQAATNAGDITAKGLRFKQRRLTPRGAGARFEAQIGAGNASVDLQTENGAITLRSGPRQMLPPPDSTTTVPSDTTAPARTDTSADTTGR